MFQTVFVVLKRGTCIIWWVNINALNLPSEFLFQRLQRQQVVPVDQYVVENVLLTHPVRRMVRLLWVFDKNSRLQPWPVVFPNPGEFEFLLGCHNHPVRVPSSLLTTPHMPCTVCSFSRASARLWVLILWIFSHFHWIAGNLSIPSIAMSAHSGWPVFRDSRNLFSFSVSVCCKMPSIFSRVSTRASYATGEVTMPTNSLV